ncbi:phosphotransferase [Candidatus Collierbacteria bacterium]|nr:phosphotransferase [Candidatus Collierbacteria bacterium]
MFKRLFGGHRNKVYKTNGFVKVIWKDGFRRQNQIREGVSLENFVATHIDIKARMLVDKSKPVEEEDGGLVTYFHYAEGEIRYPWNLDEIASAAKLLTRFHQHLKAWPSPRGPGLIRQLHLDFARGNVLFQPGSSNAIGVIDFETTAIGPVEQDLGRTLSFILVDSPINLNREDPLRSILQGSSFFERWNTLLTNYSLTFRKDKVINWTLRYLTDEDYGSLNYIRDKAISWLHDSVVNNLTI